jgi:hypothetical protein
VSGISGTTQTLDSYMAIVKTKAKAQGVNTYRAASKVIVECYHNKVTVDKCVRLLITTCGKEW